MDSLEEGTRRDARDRLDRRASYGRDVLPGAVMACASDVTRELQAGVALDALRPAIVEFARTVRAQDVPPERALAAFKFMVFNLPAISSRAPDERAELMAALTQMSIEEYYAERADR
jgi:hypothetical protein